MPIPVGEQLSTWQVFTKWFELMGILTAYGKKQDAIEKLGKGKRSNEFSYKVSGPIDLQQLKRLSK